MIFTTPLMTSRHPDQPVVVRGLSSLRERGGDCNAVASPSQCRFHHAALAPQLGGAVLKLGTEAK